MIRLIEIEANALRLRKYPYVHTSQCNRHFLRKFIINTYIYMLHFD